MPGPRARSGCQSCRVRHLKCDDSKPSCSRCAKAQIECVRGYNIRFRHGANPSVDLKGGPQCEYDFSDDQPWLKTAATLSFVDETRDLASIYEVEVSSLTTHLDSKAQAPSPLSSAASTPHETSTLQPFTEQFKNANESPQTPTEVDSPRASFSPAKKRKLSGGTHTSQEPSYSPYGPTSAYLPSPSSARFDFSSFSPSLTIASPPAPSYNAPPASHFDLSTPVDFPEISNVSVGTYQENVWPLSNYEEARLVRYFSQEVAPNFDMCDPQRHFELVVPARAATCPILHNAILAASTRQLSRVDDLDPYVSNSYHQECLKYLIPLLSDEAAILDENILAAGVVLRYIEEIETPVSASETDPDNSEGQHMFGTNLLMAAQEQLTTLTGGLCYAAYFVALRQEIHCAFAHQRTIAPSLTHANIDRSLGPADPTTWANRIVVHNADVLRYCFDPDPHADRSPARFQALDDYTAAWQAAKPTSMRPLFERSADPDAGRIFPDTWFASPLAVCAIQQYHLCVILLAAHDPRVPRLGPARRAALAAVDEKLRNTVIAQCSVALSNETAHAAYVYASLGIGMCGERFQERNIQEALLSVLERTENAYAWPTGQARKALRAAWGW